MSVLDLSLPRAKAPARRPVRIHETETETEDMPFAVNLDRPVLVERMVWLTLASFALALLVALI